MIQEVSGKQNAEFSIYDKCGPLLCVYPFFSRALESAPAQCVFQKGCPRLQPRVPTQNPPPPPPPTTTPPACNNPISHTSDSPPFLSSHLFIRAAACCFTGTSPCFVLFSPLFVFNCYGGGQLISLPPPPPPPPPALSAAHTAVARCILLAHLLPSPNATSLQMD